MADFAQDLPHTLRQWKRSPAFVVMAILTVAMGAGGTTTVLSVTDALLLRSLPGIRAPEGLVEIRVGDRAGRSRRMMAYPTFRALRDADVGLSGLSAVGYSEMGFSAQGTSEVLGGMAVSPSYFDILGTRPALGRFFDATEDEAAGGGPVVVLSHDLWMRGFNGDPSVLGQSVRVNRQPLTIIGVAQEDFHGHLPLHEFSLWVPLGVVQALTGQDPASFHFLTVGRLAPGSSPARVRAATEAVARDLRSEDPVAWASQVFVVEPHTRAYQEFRGPITLFMGFLLALAVAILLIAASNLAGILLSRATARSQEIAVRQAMGAGRVRLVGQLVTESVLLFALGGVGGTLLAFWATGALGRIPIPREIPLTGDFAPDLRVLAVSMAVTLAVGILFGMAPALRATRTDLASVLRDDGGQAQGTQRLRMLFVVAQVTGAVVLLGGSGVLFRALQRAGSMDLGFEPRGVQVATVNLDLRQYAPAEGRLFLQRLLREASDLPGVSSAALADFVFLVSPPRRSGVFSAEGGEGSVEAGLLGVSPDFFEATGVQVLEGRAFQPSDREGTEPVAMVNETVARILWPGESPVGKALRRDEDLYRVVALVRNSKYISVGEGPLAGVFLPQARYYVPQTSLLLKLREGRRDIRRELDELVRAIDPLVPLSTNAPYPDLVDIHFLPRRLAGGFAGVLGVMGLFLACVGLYGVLSHRVTLQTREMAIRMALGAEASSVRRPVILGGMGLVLLGILLGTPLAMGTANLMRVFLYGMDPLDPVLYTGVALALFLVAFAASFVPALRATRTDPARVLHQR
jgi:predicted permease